MDRTAPRQSLFTRRPLIAVACVVVGATLLFLADAWYGHVRALRFRPVWLRHTVAR